jgi:glycosyltransferase involved in cell wall biosynthesis
MKITLVVPTINEITGMREIMPRIKREWVDQILVIDGGSTDGTLEYAREQNYTVVSQTSWGMRNAYLDAWDKITGDVVITFSPDGNSIPEMIPPLIAKMKEGHDMVIVSRYLSGATSEDDDLLTGFGNWFFTRTVNWLHGGKYTDVMVMYRAYRKNLVYELELDQEKWYRVPERLFFCRISWEPLLSVRAARRKLRVAEIPGDEPKRIGGERKLRVFRWGAACYFQFLRDALFFPKAR